MGKLWWLPVKMNVHLIYGVKTKIGFSKWALPLLLTYNIVSATLLLAYWDNQMQLSSELVIVLRKHL